MLMIEVAIKVPDANVTIPRASNFATLGSGVALVLEHGFGDGLITTHLATGTWRTAASLEHRDTRANKRGCSKTYASLERKLCAPYIHSTFVASPPSRPRASPPPVLTGTLNLDAHLMETPSNWIPVIMYWSSWLSSWMPLCCLGLLAYRLLGEVMKRCVERNGL